MATAEQKRLAAVRAKLRAQVLSGQTHYETLGVPPGVNALTLRGTYLYLGRVFHPDRCDLPDATDLMARVNVAYACLSDSAARRKYDAVNHTVRSVCTACKGVGKVLKQKGFRSKVAVDCPACAGTGNQQRSAT